MCSNILDPKQKVYVDTLDPSKISPGAVGAFRHRWARDLASRYASAGCLHNIVWANETGNPNLILTTLFLLSIHIWFLISEICFQFFISTFA